MKFMTVRHHPALITIAGPLPEDPIAVRGLAALNAAIARVGRDELLSLFVAAVAITAAAIAIL
jgi:hypothetical protein